MHWQSQLKGENALNAILFALQGVPTISEMTSNSRKIAKNGKNCFILAENSKNQNFGKAVQKCLDNWTPCKLQKDAANDVAMPFKIRFLYSCTLY